MNKNSFDRTSKKKGYLGFDTSCYTTSAAVYYPTDNTFRTSRNLLSVESGQHGLRQSDALFQHIKQIGDVLSEIELDDTEIMAVGVSSTPTSEENSYMPVFLAGKAVGQSVAKVLNVNLHEFSHQAGHIAAGVVSSGEKGLLDEKFLSFHLSGGTTDLLSVSPSEENIFDIRPLAKTLDATAGQIIDRVGVKMGFRFPAGKFIEQAAMKSDKVFNPHVYAKDGNASFSGLENQCEKMMKTENINDVARYCLDYIYEAIRQMTDFQIKKTGIERVLFVGGVMSNEIIRSRLGENFDCCFAQREFSTDNALGIAFLTSLLEEK